ATAPRGPSRRVLQGSRGPADRGGLAGQGVALVACQTRLAEQPLLDGLKNLNRLELVLARSEWSDSEHAEGLMRDTSGRLIEGVYSNLFLVSQGRLLTADLCRGGVAGVMRAELPDQAPRLRLALDIRDLDMPDLVEGDRVILGA
ncbi:aminodeoxychorismate lyase, partial [Pseudomonas syringae]